MRFARVLRSPVLVTSWRRVASGTNGAVSLVGLVASLTGGLFVGAVWLASVLLLTDASLATQWILLPLGAAYGFLGSLMDSLLGATLQFSGLSESGEVVDAPGKGVKRICGLDVLSNDGVNLAAAALTAALAPSVALRAVALLGPQLH